MGPNEPVRRRVPGWLIAVGSVAAFLCVAGTASAVVRDALRRQASESAPASVLGPAGDGEAPADTATTTTPASTRDGLFEFAVRSVGCGRATVDNGWLHARAKGAYCVVDLTVANIGTEPRRFADGLQRAFGPGGVSYAADTGAGVVANGSGDGIWQVVNPGLSLSVKVVYDIPVGATIDRLELHDSGFSRGVQVAVRPTA